MNYSKGEWTLPHFVTRKTEKDCDCGYIFAWSGEQLTGCIANVYHKKDEVNESDYPEIDEAKGNARLICASPKMYKLLKDILNGDLDLKEIDNLIKEIEGWMDING